MPALRSALAHCKEIRIIDGEHVNCDAADGGSSDEFCPREMVAPAVLAWAEKPDEVVGGSLVSGDVRTLVPVAVQASQGKIADGSIRNDFLLVARLAGPRPGSLIGSVVRLLMQSHPGPGLHYSQ
jgi:hypothetical protein